MNLFFVEANDVENPVVVGVMKYLKTDELLFGVKIVVETSALAEQRSSDQNEYIAPPEKRSSDLYTPSKKFSYEAVVAEDDEQLVVQRLFVVL